MKQDKQILRCGYCQHCLSIRRVEKASNSVLDDNKDKHPEKILKELKRWAKTSLDDMRNWYPCLDPRPYPTDRNEVEGFEI